MLLFGPLNHVGIHVIRFPRSERVSQHAAVLIDYLTQWPGVFAIPDQTSLITAHLLVEQLISKHGVPRELLSDCSTAFC